MQAKIKELNELKTIVGKLKREGKKIVFTNGCFDLIHVGHVRYLEQAKKWGDILIVALNSDSSVRELKGLLRPIIPGNERMEVIASLEVVDYVIIFADRTASRILEEIKPDIYVKGGDYTLKTLPEWPIVRKYGGLVELVAEVKGRSTSDIIEKIRGDVNEIS